MTDQRVRIEEGQKRVRVLVGGEFVADSTRVKLVWEHPHYPVYYFPQEDVRTDLFVATGETDHSPSRGDAQLHSVKTADREVQGAARWYVDSRLDGLLGTVAFDWDAMDAWFEEDEQVYVHARDPYTRVDVLQSSRRVRVEVDDVAVADSNRPRLLFETGLPIRYYLPKTDVRLDVLLGSARETRCPYKGVASYYSVQVDGETHEDLVWWYPYPTSEAADIAGYLAFYNERVDLYVDGELQDRPQTPFS